ncbi:SRPBCC family protein [Urechidicola croceus]|uniref:Bacterial transcription activator effector binding domain-containing protein n=1 Tax=Urechidicola croceus TaxID=1850246 RepID=A0A1D8P7J1_9FLAO|nr:effector binding domain-containing protein [Urechidicola croceus]AOW20518.1 hypothetical protein LPB138_07440 [Urechidicola croceus]
MKFLKYFLLLFSAIIIFGSIYIAVKDGSYEIKQSRFINAPASVLFENVNDFKNWPEWNPWMEVDPTIKPIFPSKTVGVNGAYSWTSKNGDGSMKTISTNLNKEIIQELTYGTGNPSIINWVFNSSKDSTEVVWSMKGESSFGEKLYWLTQGGIEKNVAPMLSRGLELLDTVITKDIKKYSITINGETEHGGGFYLYNTSSSSIQIMNTKMGDMFTALYKYAEKNSINIAGAPFALYHKFDMENNSVIFSCAIPTSSKVISTDGNILTGQLIPFKSYKVTLNGDYSNLQEAWTKGMEELQNKGFTYDQSQVGLESYITDPEKTPNPKNLITEIFIPIKQE